MEDKNNINSHGDPDNYWDEMYAPSLSKIEKKNCFTVPEGYFEKLPAAVESAIFLAQTGEKNPFTVPENYFEKLPQLIENKVFLENLKKEDRSDIPAGYFDGLSEKIQGRIFVESVKKTDSPGIPEGYFDRLPDIIQTKIAEEESKKIRIISISKWAKNKYSYVAVAASLAILIGLFGVFKKLQPKPAEKGVSIALNESDKKFVAEHSEMYDIDESLLAEQVSDEGVTELKLQGLSKDDVLNYLSKENNSVAEDL